MEISKKYKAISFRVPLERYADAKKIAERQGMAPGVMARVALFEYLEKLNKA